MKVCIVGASGKLENESNRAETLQFWIDAQLPPALAQWLQRAHGTEARHVEDLGLHRAEDTKIFIR